jgi:aminoglycoside phosphotransferase family enzyme
VTRADPGLDAKLAFLRLPCSYPEATYRVEARETHMSWVFLLDTCVYKLKKPVRYDCLDFRTLVARRFYCEEELRLNRRLAPEVYLGLASLNLDSHGHLALGGSGEPVDWLVRMRRLPAARMLDALILHGALRAVDLDRLAGTLAAFYRSLPPEHPDPADFRTRLCRRIEDDAAGLASGPGALPPALVGPVAAAQLATVARLADVLATRIRHGRIVEGHGDLRPEHVCLEHPVSIIDCLEFARALRVLDVADELAFLALECERLGAPAAAAALLDRFWQLAGDRPPPALVSFYKSVRSTSRGHIALRHLDEPHLRHSAHWRQRAAQYLQLAKSHIDAAGASQRP